jgi:hypothetical protein
VEELFTLVAKTYGLVGLLILFPFVACYFIWRENKRLTGVIERNAQETAKRVQECNDKIIEAQKQRVADAQAITSKLVEMVSEQSALNKETNLALDRISEILSGLRTR